MADKIKGGKADKKKPSDFDSKELKKGQKVEREHTSDKDVAKEIAMDHLEEFPKYYEALDKMEKELKEDKHKQLELNDYKRKNQ
jgi:hypothetical protein